MRRGRRLWLRGLRYHSLVRDANRNDRQVDDERRALTLARRDRDAALHPPHELAADVEAETRAPDAAGLLGIEPVELPEDPLLLAVRDPEALVADRDLQGAFSLLHADLDAAAV